MFGTKTILGRTAWLAVAVVLGPSTSAALRAQETYDLRGPALTKGAAFVGETQVKIKDATVKARTGGMELDLGKASMDEVKKVEVVILALDGRDVTKMRTKLVKDSTTVKGNLGGQDINETEEDPLTGKVIVSTWTGKGWKHTLEDGKPSEKEAEKLEEFDGAAQEYALYPEARVAVGHKWELDAATLQKGMFSAMNLNEVTGKATARFVRIAEVGGESCAVIEVDLSVKGTREMKGQKVPFTMSGKQTNYRSLKTGVTLKDEFDGKLSMTVVENMDGVKIEMDIAGPVTGQTTTTIKK